MSTTLSDEEFARKLQAEEDAAAAGIPRQHYQSSSSSFEDEDAQLARQLSAQSFRNEPYHSQRGFGNAHNVSHPASSSSGGPSRGGGKFTIKSGQKTAVRLHHPLTKNHIGEVMYAHYITQTEVRFELVKTPGKCLRVTDQGRVEFSACAEDDRSSHFRFELTIQGPMYLLCKAYIDNINISGERSWFLALNNLGQLQGNSSRGQHSRWVLVAAQDPNTFSQGPQRDGGAQIQTGGGPNTAMTASTSSRSASSSSS